MRSLVSQLINNDTTERNTWGCRTGNKHPLTGWCRGSPVEEEVQRGHLVVELWTTGQTQSFIFILLIWAWEALQVREVRFIALIQTESCWLNSEHVEIFCFPLRFLLFIIISPRRICAAFNFPLNMNCSSSSSSSCRPLDVTEKTSLDCTAVKMEEKEVKKYKFLLLLNQNTH